MADLTLADAAVGDKVTIEFAVTKRESAFPLIRVKSETWDSDIALTKTTPIKSITRAPKFKAGDRVTMVGRVSSNYGYINHVNKIGTIKFLDENRAWVMWDKNTRQEAHESLVKLSNLFKKA